MASFNQPTGITVVNRRRDQEDIYIGRGSPLGNPFIIGKDGDRDEVLFKYKKYLQSEINNNNRNIINALEAIKERSMHSNVSLGCYCKPKPCHGDVIKDYIEIFMDRYQPCTTEVVAFTGHRPNKLGGYDYQSTKNQEIYSKMRAAVEQLKPSRIITGMALGVDTMAADIAYMLDIPFTAAIPFKGQELKWHKESQELYHQILKAADKIVIVSEGGYSAYKMQVRNQWMVDNCTHLIAVWDGTTGGTGNCVAYTEGIGKPVTYIKP